MAEIKNCLKSHAISATQEHQSLYLPKIDRN